MHSVMVMLNKLDNFKPWGRYRLDDYYDAGQLFLSKTVRVEKPGSFDDLMAKAAPAVFPISSPLLCRNRRFADARALAAKNRPPIKPIARRSHPTP